MSYYLLCWDQSIFCFVSLLDRIMMNLNILIILIGFVIFIIFYLFALFFLYLFSLFLLFYLIKFCYYFENYHFILLFYLIRPYFIIAKSDPLNDFIFIFYFYFYLILLLSKIYHHHSFFYPWNLKDFKIFISFIQLPYFYIHFRQLFSLFQLTSCFITHRIFSWLIVFYLKFIHYYQLIEFDLDSLATVCF